MVQSYLQASTINWAEQQGGAVPSVCFQNSPRGWHVTKALQTSMAHGIVSRPNLARLADCARADR